ncbi:MAG TPA: glycosyltransferase [Dongiaceae bacterium]|nr:glycosyltransferase [Dongiaceae bacterium]
MTSDLSTRALSPDAPMSDSATAQAASRSQARRVLFIINSLAGGGAERVMCTLLRASEAEQRDCSIALLLLDREAAAYEVPAWVEVRQLDCRQSLIRSVWSVFHAMRQMRPAVTVSFLTRANVANVIAAAILRIPAIISERVDTSSHLGGGLGASVARRLVRATYPRARKVIAVSQGVADSLYARFGVMRERTTVIANPIDLDAIRAQAARGAPLDLPIPYIVAGGRLMPNKNFPLLIDAFARADIPETLVILGEGPERAALAEKIAALGLQNRVVMPGFIDNPFPTISRAALYVSSSNAEGFPNALLEAMSTSVPVIATNCPSGPAEVLAEMPRAQVGTGVTQAPHGLLVPPNDPAALAEALRIMQAPEQRRIYGERAARRAADFGVQRAKDAYWEVIRATL